MLTLSNANSVSFELAGGRRIKIWYCNSCCSHSHILPPCFPPLPSLPPSNRYGVDCLMLRYAGIDWLALDPPECNRMRNPYLTLFNDGMNQNPLEVVFVKVKPHILASDHTLQRFSDYVLGRDGDLGSSGLYTPVMQNVLSYRKEKLARMVEDCHASFDHESFIAQHPELEKETPQARYDTFLSSHLFSGKPYQYLVPQTREEDVTPYYCQSFMSYGAPDFFG